MTDIVRNLQQNNLKEMYQKQGINYVGLFGSFARGEETLKSDVDILVDFNKTKTLFDLANVKIFFQDNLGKKVDLVMKNNIKEILVPYINNDLITVYEKN